jgi:L-threonylcarbamoyladenylate synthase
MITVPLAEILAPGNLRRISDCLHDKGVIAYPTDTLYGLGGDFFSRAVINKIDIMKNRSDLPYSVAVASLAMMEALVAEIPGIFHDRLQGLLPGKFTFLLRPNPAIDSRLVKNSGKIGIRIPGLPPLLQLIEAQRLPLVSTSVNRSGRPPLNDPQLIARAFPELDLLIDGGILPPSPGSTLVDLTVAPPRILRRGADLEKIKAILGDNDPV